MFFYIVHDTENNKKRELFMPAKKTINKEPVKNHQAYSLDLKKKINGLPKKARHIHMLTFLENTLSNGSRINSQRKVLPALKKLKSIASDQKFTHYFKKNTPGSRISELEAYCGAICQLIATDEYVPSVTPYYDDQNQFVGVTSKVIPGFQSARDNPLQANDTIMDSQAIKILHQQNILIENIDALLDQLRHSPEKVDNNTYFNFYLFSTQKMDKVGLEKVIDTFKNHHNKFSPDIQTSLLNALRMRQDYLAASGINQKYIESEFTCLNRAIQSIESLRYLQMTNLPMSINLEELQEFDRIIKLKKINLERCGDHLVGVINGKRIQINTKELINFRIVKGLAVTLTTRFIFKEGDNHNQNISKFGPMIDFDMTKLNILSQFKEIGLLDKLLREPPNKKMFACTANDVHHLPDISDANFYYWPTKQTKLSTGVRELILRYLDAFEDPFCKADDEIFKYFSGLASEVCTAVYNTNDPNESYRDKICNLAFSLIIKIKTLLISNPESYSYEQKKEIFNILKRRVIDFLATKINKVDTIEDAFWDVFNKDDHRYTQTDNEIYKNLSTHPVFIFYKYKTFLKYILTDESMYRCIASLYISQNGSDNNAQRNLSDELVRDEVDRIAEIKGVLLKMPQFKEFLNEYGKHAFNEIKNELSELKFKHEQKLIEKPYYASLVNSLDLKLIDERYNAILSSVGVGRDVACNVNFQQKC